MSILVAFTAKLKEGVEERYRVLSKEVLEQALRQPGLIFPGPGAIGDAGTGHRLRHEWASEEALLAWKDHPVSAGLRSWPLKSSLNPIS